VRLPVPIVYAAEPDLPASQFRDVLVASTLAERRPVEDLERLDSMLRNADLIVTARDDGRLIGIARSITDHAYCCYLSDLAVDVAYQKQGIGRRLIAETHARAGAGTALILIAAPKAESYYPHIGMQHVASAWQIPRKR
jgi:predicted N-acetyltransferase YhbS